jgi:hypothetical protein
MIRAYVFTGYTFTLESGFPDEAIKIVLSSIRNSDQFVARCDPRSTAATPHKKLATD